MTDVGELLKEAELIKAPPRQEGVSFGVAVHALLRGHTMRRKAWGNQFVFHTPGFSEKRENVLSGGQVDEFLQHHDTIKTPAGFQVVHVDQGVLDFWRPAPFDLTAADWLPYGPNDALRDELIRRMRLLEQIEDDDDELVAQKVLEMIAEQLMLLDITYMTKSDQVFKTFRLQKDYEGIAITYNVEDRIYSVVVPGDDPKVIEPNCDLVAEIGEARAILGNLPRDREFYHTMLMVDVLSEGTIPTEMVPDDILREMDSGEFVGRTKRIATIPLHRKDVVAATKAYGSSPDFFNLDAEGNDLDE